MGDDSKWTLAIVAAVLVAVTVAGLVYFSDSLKSKSGPMVLFEGSAKLSTVLSPYAPTRGSESERTYRVLTTAGFCLAEMRTSGESRQPVTFLFRRGDGGAKASLSTDRTRVLHGGITVLLAPGRADDLRGAVALMRSAFLKGSEGPAPLWKVLESYTVLLGRNEGDGAAAARDLAAASDQVVADLVRKGADGDRLCLGARTDEGAVWWRVAPLRRSDEDVKPSVTIEVSEVPPAEVVPFLLSEEEMLRLAARP